MKGWIVRNKISNEKLQIINLKMGLNNSVKPLTSGFHMGLENWHSLLKTSNRKAVKVKNSSGTYHETEAIGTIYDINTVKVDKEIQKITTYWYRNTREYPPGKPSIRIWKLKLKVVNYERLCVNQLDT